MRKDPKTRHGRDKKPEKDDPMELVMSPVAGGDPEVMATCLVEEYARIGMGEDEILSLFSRPVYQTHALYETRGEGWVRALVRNVMTRTGRTRIKVKVTENIGGRDA